MCAVVVLQQAIYAHIYCATNYTLKIRTASRTDEQTDGNVDSRKFHHRRTRERPCDSIFHRQNALSKNL